MRLTTDFWVSAVVRRVFSAGGFAAVERRGSSEAGAVLITQRDRFGETTLYGPAPQSSYEGAKPEDRLFTQMLASKEPDAIRQRVEREIRFDPDVWVVELEVDDALFGELIQTTTS